MHTGVVSGWSPSLQVDIETISFPNTPTGPSPVQVNVSNTYTTGGAACGLGDAVTYSFNWGDGTNSGFGAPSASHAWSTAGTYQVTASARCTLNNQAMSTSAALPVTVTGAPSSITATGGTPQSTPVNTAFVDLQVTVLDSLGQGVPNVLVTFTVHPSAGGASGTFPSSNTATTNASGQASVPFTANGTAGSYTVTATAPGVAAPATFSLTNTP